MTTCFKYPNQANYIQWSIFHNKEWAISLALDWTHTWMIDTCGVCVQMPLHLSIESIEDCIAFVFGQMSSKGSIVLRHFNVFKNRALPTNLRKLGTVQNLYIYKSSLSAFTRLSARVVGAYAYISIVTLLIVNDECLVHRHGGQFFQ